MYDWTPLAGRVPDWLPARTMLLVRQGSQAYGTATSTSDEDVKGVCVPPREVLLSFESGFEQAVTSTPDVVVYELRKFFSLAAECNPGIIEMLFVEDEDVLVVTTLGARLRAARALFLSRKARQTFAGYALAQLKRIRAHRRWLESPPKAPPTRAEFGLPDHATLSRDELGIAEAQVRKQLESWSPDLEGLDPAQKIGIQNRWSRTLAEMGLASDESRFRAAASAVGMNDRLFELLQNERRFRASQNEWKQFESWQRERNPARAALEAKFGYDTKHAMHLVRLLRMCREILDTGRVLVRRPDAQELLDIRGGAWTYDELLAWAEEQDRAIDRALETSSLPPAPDRRGLDELCVELMWQGLATS